MRLDKYLGPLDKKEYKLYAAEYCCPQCSKTFNVFVPAGECSDDNIVQCNNCGQLKLAEGYAPGGISDFMNYAVEVWGVEKSELSNPGTIMDFAFLSMYENECESCSCGGRFRIGRKPRRCPECQTIVGDKHHTGKGDELTMTLESLRFYSLPLAE